MITPFTTFQMLIVTGFVQEISVAICQAEKVDIINVCMDISVWTFATDHYDDRLRNRLLCITS